MAKLSEMMNYNGRSQNRRILMVHLKLLRIVMVPIQITLHTLPSLLWLPMTQCFGCCSSPKNKSFKKRIRVYDFSMQNNDFRLAFENHIILSANNQRFEKVLWFTGDTFLGENFIQHGLYIYFPYMIYTVASHFYSNCVLCDFVVHKISKNVYDKKIII